MKKSRTAFMAAAFISLSQPSLADTPQSNEQWFDQIDTLKTYYPSSFIKRIAANQEMDVIIMAKERNGSGFMNTRFFFLYSDRENGNWMLVRSNTQDSHKIIAAGPAHLMPDNPDSGHERCQNIQSIYFGINTDHRFMGFVETEGHGDILSFFQGNQNPDAPKIKMENGTFYWESNSEGELACSDPVNVHRTKRRFPHAEARLRR